MIIHKHILVMCLLLIALLLIAAAIYLNHGAREGISVEVGEFEVSRFHEHLSEPMRIGCVQFQVPITDLKSAEAITRGGKPCVLLKYSNSRILVSSPFHYEGEEHLLRVKLGTLPEPISNDEVMARLVIHILSLKNGFDRITGLTNHEKRVLRDIGNLIVPLEMTEVWSVYQPGIKGYVTKLNELYEFLAYSEDEMNQWVVKAYWDGNQQSCHDLLGTIIRSSQLDNGKCSGIDSPDIDDLIRAIEVAIKKQSVETGIAPR